MTASHTNCLSSKPDTSEMILARHDGTCDDTKITKNKLETAYITQKDLRPGPRKVGLDPSREGASSCDDNFFQSRVTRETHRGLLEVSC